MILQFPDILGSKLKWHTAPSLKYSQSKVGTIEINELDSTELKININTDFVPGDSLVLTEGYAMVLSSAPDISFKLIGSLNSNNIDLEYDIQNQENFHVTKPSLSISSKNFVVNDTSVPFPQIKITESSRYPSIYSSSPELENSILIRLVDDCITWDTNVTSVSYDGSYSGTPPSFNYTDGNKIVGFKMVCKRIVSR